jgi:hypothetical protein
MKKAASLVEAAPCVLLSVFFLNYLFLFLQDKTGIRSTVEGCNSRMRSKPRMIIMTRLARLFINPISISLPFQLQ